MLSLILHQGGVVIAPEPFPQPVPLAAPDFVEYPTCKTCGGDGKVIGAFYVRDIEDFVSEPTPCPVCDGACRLQVIGRRIRGVWFVLIRPTSLPNWLPKGLCWIGECDNEADAREGETRHASPVELRKRDPIHRAVLAALGFDLKAVHE